MRRNSTIILESTVYPGVAEEVVKPILEQESGYLCGEDFRLAYSPERANPGDKEHTLQNITKIVASIIDEKTTQLVDQFQNNIEAIITKHCTGGGPLPTSGRLGLLRAGHPHR